MKINDHEFTLREKQIYDWIYSIHPKKIDYSFPVQKKIIHTIGNWLNLDLKKDRLIDMDDPKFSGYFKILKEYLQKPEFFPYFCTFGELLNSEKLIYQIDKFYYIVSLCESEPKRFKYVIQTSERTFLKNKFDVLSDGKIKLNKLSLNSDFYSDDIQYINQDFIIDNYEALKKIVCENYLDVKQLNFSNPSLILANFQKSNQKNMKNFNYQRLFYPSQNLVFQTSDGNIPFSLDLMLTWSNTIANIDRDLGQESYHLPFPFSKKGLILYILYRLRFIHMNNISEADILDLKLDLVSTKGFIEYHQELYRIADYLEDKEMIEWIVPFFENNVTDMYTRQKFIEFIYL
jgi:hypothetical protein